VACSKVLILLLPRTVVSTTITSQGQLLPPVSAPRRGAPSDPGECWL